MDTGGVLVEHEFVGITDGLLVKEGADCRKRNVVHE
jgi:hypothetical protein